MLITHRVNTALFFLLIALLITASFFYTLPWWLFCLPVLLWLVFAVAGSGLVWTGYHIKTYCNNASVKQNSIAITFDDGPTPETPKVLDLLDKYGAKATFFCIGRQVEKHPEILQRIIAEGHTVGNHTLTHNPQMGLWSEDKVVNELNITNNDIEKHTGKAPLFFRPPYGVTYPALAKALKKTGHKAIGWNIRSLDAVIKDENKIFRRIKTRLKPGSIILLHDTSQKSVNVLEQLLVLLQQNKYEAVTVDRLLNIPAYEE